jgi:DoxX-like family
VSSGPPRKRSQNPQIAGRARSLRYLRWGGVTLLAPRLPRLKEWAYAGICFDLTGAAISHAASGDGAGKVTTPLVLLAVAIASWSLRPQSRRLAAALREAKEGDAARCRLCARTW